MPHAQPSDDPSTHSSEDERSDSGLSKKRKKAVSRAIKERASKKKKKSPLSRYTQLAAWYNRSEEMDANWYAAFDHGVAWDNQDFGELTRQQYSKKYGKSIDLYHQIGECVRQFEDDLSYFEAIPDGVDNLVSAMVEACGIARGNDISSLKEACLFYTAQAERNQRLEPTIPRGSSKQANRGFKHPQLARLLCPINLIPDFDADPVKFQQLLLGGKIKVRSHDMPSFLWAKDGYDPEDVAYGMFRNSILVMVFRHIFTSPSSAMSEHPGQTKTRPSQAQKNEMKTVTPGSIAYTCLIYRHSISGVEDWRHDDRLFKRTEFYQHVLKVFDDAVDGDPLWLQETIEWWNVQVLGLEAEAIDDSDNELGPSTISVIHRQRQERLARQQAQEATSSKNASAANPEPASTQSSPPMPAAEVPVNHPTLPTPPSSLAPPPSSFAPPQAHAQQTQFQGSLSPAASFINPEALYSLSQSSYAPEYDAYLGQCGSHLGWEDTNCPSELGPSRVNDENEPYPPSQPRHHSTAQSSQPTHFSQPSFGVPYDRPILANHN